MRTILVADPKAEIEKQAMMKGGKTDIHAELCLHLKPVPRLSASP